MDLNPELVLGRKGIVQPFLGQEHPVDQPLLPLLAFLEAKPQIGELRLDCTGAPGPFDLRLSFGSVQRSSPFRAPASQRIRGFPRLGGNRSYFAKPGCNRENLGQPSLPRRGTGIERPGISVCDRAASCRGPYEPDLSGRVVPKRR